MRPFYALLTVSAVLVTGAGCASPTSDDDTGNFAEPPPAGTPWIVTGGPSPSPTAGTPGMPAQAPLAVTKSAGTFQPVPQGTTAVTYDTKVVPAGATAAVEVGMTAVGAVVVGLTVTGMVPKRQYGAHLHTQPCTATPDAAGPHYQHQADPSKPSVDPAYANPANEVWLDFAADERGAAKISSEQRWSFDPVSPPRSLVVHAERTRTEAGKAGTAGARVACLTLRG